MRKGYHHKKTDAAGNIWYFDQNGKFHREDGPALIKNNGAEEWWRHGCLHREDGPAVTTDVMCRWYREGKLHREDGPAIELADGTKEWYREGKLHREDGPAIEDADGTRRWYLDGKRHRADGPAVEYQGGRGGEHYLMGKMFVEEDFRKIIDSVTLCVMTSR